MPKQNLINLDWPKKERDITWNNMHVQVRSPLGTKIIINSPSWARYSAKVVSLSRNSRATPRATMILFLYGTPFLAPGT